MRRRSLALCLVLMIAWAAPVSADEAAEILPEGKIEAKVDRKLDRRIEKRLLATFAALEGLEAVRVEVETGVVTLSGTVNSADAHDLADTFARRIEGVTAVDNQLEETRAVSTRLALAIDRLAARGLGLVDGLPLLLLALGVLVVSIVGARVVVRWQAPFRWLTGNVFLRDLAKQAVQAGIIVAAALVALEILDATALVGAVLGAAGVVGLALGFGLRDLIENYLASILLSLRQPFSPSDLVRIEGHEGRVARLTSRATILITHDGNHVRIPNGIVFKAVIENLTRKPERRFSFGVGVGVDEDLVAAQDRGTAIIAGMDGVIQKPSPFCRVEELGDSSVTLRFFGWVDQHKADFQKVRSEAIRLVKKAFDQSGIEMPEPIHRLRVESQNATTQPRVERPAPSAEATRDVSRDHHVEALVREERGAPGDDLLSASAAQE